MSRKIYKIQINRPKNETIFLTVAISAASAIGSVAVYNNYFTKHEVIVGEAKDKLPANYAGFMMESPGFQLTELISLKPQILLYPR